MFKKFRYSGYYFPFSHWHHSASWLIGGNVFGGNWWDVNKHGQFVDSFCILGFCFERRKYTITSGKLEYKVNVFPFCPDDSSTMLEIELYIDGKKSMGVSSFSTSIENQTKAVTLLKIKELGQRLGLDLAARVADRSGSDIHNALITTYSDEPWCKFYKK